MAKKTVVAGVSNDASEALASEMPYLVDVVLVGTAPILMHRWSCDDIEKKASAKKGSTEKKTDNVESYVYRDDAGLLCLPGEYLRQSIIHAAKFQQDPRSPRKSAMDLFKAGVVTMTELAPFEPHVTDWNYIDRRRVCIQRNGITRMRPAMLKGWKASIQLQVLTPEYISLDRLNEAITVAGRLIGVGDFRPTFGRFRVEKFEKTELT